MKELDALRDKIDSINEGIIALFAERLKTVRQIAIEKKKQKLPVLDEKREARQLESIRTLAQKHGLSPQIMEEIFDLFVEYSRMEMKLEMNKEA